MVGLGSKLEAPFSLQSQQELLRSKPTDFLRRSFKGCHRFVKRQRNIFQKYRSLLARNVGNVREYYKTGCESWPRAMLQTRMLT